MASRRDPALVALIERYLRRAAFDLEWTGNDSGVPPILHHGREDRLVTRRIRPLSDDLFAMGRALRGQQNLFMALFRRGGKRGAGAPVRVPVFADEAGGDRTHLLAGLERSGIPLMSATQAEFIRQAAVRAAEFATLAGEARTGMTTVHTPRDGETVVFCKGYFLSTVAGFGQSTPAHKAIPPGQYCFGVMRTDGLRFQDLVWDCPTNLHLDLP